MLEYEMRCRSVCRESGEVSAKNVLAALLLCIAKQAAPSTSQQAYHGLEHC